ncbi:uncharacterized protein si:ch211-199g17.2 isoform X2 [Onychostoma macrolepis]|uniref:uncharacterized protein si:ch211-199g17.2 isoform X2 n=1 Tax=Onychostoma macrolepis TaxID=369639 RepID=UPI00272AA6E3|nr:uncharacterized protein si:ch211-199g17.2 isoform X2 [Onychostoma macrolepis]
MGCNYFLTVALTRLAKVLILGILVCCLLGSPVMFAASSAGCHSHLYNSIRSYLQNQNRAQPIVGLNSITEVLAYNQPALYFCDVCILRITKADIRNHIMGSIHRYNYIKSHHAHGWTSDTDLTLLARPLMDIAKKVEKKEGTGDIQVLGVDEVIYKEMTSIPVPDAFAQMKKIKDQRNHDAPNLLVHNSTSGKETSAQGQQESDNMNGTAQPNLGCLVPTQCVSTTPSRSKCSSVIEPQQVSTNPTPNPSLHRTAGPVKPLFTCQDVSTTQSLVDSHVSSRMPFLESSPAPVLSQHINQHQPISGRSFQRYIMSSENQCFTEARTISVVRPPRQCIPIRILCENDIVHAGEDDGNSSVQSFGVHYESHPLHLAQTIPYEIQLQTPSLSVSHMVPESTLDLTNRHGFFRNESSPDSPEPFRDVEIVIKQIRTQMLTEALESATTHDLSPFHDESNLQEPVNTGWEAHEEPQSDTLTEENTFVFSQSPIVQSPLTQSPSDQFQSIEDFLENYNGRKPLIGLQAVIKCQSVDGNPPPCCYLCQLCSLKLKKKKIFSHLTGCDHQRNYLKALHPQLLPKKRKHRNTNDMLEDIAIQLEKEDGRGHIKVMRLSACLISEVLEKDYHWCMKLLNCGGDVGWRSGLLSFKEGTNTTGPGQTLKRPAESVLPPSDNNTTGPSQTLKRPAESMLPPSDARALIAPAGAPTHQMSKKMKGHPKKVVCTNKVKEPVFKVSLSLQEGPVIIERTSLKETTTVAPEIEDQSPATTCTDNDAPPLATNTHSEVQMCFDSCMYEEQFTNPAHYAYSGQFDQSQVIQYLEPSLRPRDSGPVDEVVTVTYADWPLQDWSCNNNQCIVMRQNRDGSDYSECASYMQY